MEELKIRNFLLKMFTTFFMVLISYTVYVSIFNSSKQFASMNYLILIVGVSILIMLMYLLYKLLGKISCKKLILISIIAFIIMIILQICFAIYFRNNPTWDFGIVFYEAREMALGKNQLSEYFYNLYPNNIGLALLLTALFKLTIKLGPSIEAFLTVAIIFNIIIINLTILLTYMFMRKVLGQKSATLFSIFILVITPFYAYSPIVYNDTITMMFPVIMFLCLYIYRKDNNSKIKRILSLIGIAIAAAIGTILKTNIVIGLVAIIIYILFTNKLLKGIVSNGIIVVIFIVAMSVFQIMSQKYIPIKYSECGLPATHWIMMGLKGPVGQFNQEDVLFSENIKLKYGKEKVKEENIRVIKERLKDYGINGYIEFLNDKISFTWGDGTYYSVNKLERSLEKNNNIQEYVIGSKNTLFIYISQISHITILVMILISAIGSFKKPASFERSMQIGIFGVFLFLVIWEARSRYLLCYLPILIVTAFYGMNYLFKFIDNIVKEKIR